MNIDCPVHGSDPFLDTSSDDSFARFFCLCSELLNPAEGWHPSNSDSDSAQPQPNVPAPSQPIQRFITHSTEDSVSQAQTNIPGTSEPIRYPIAPPVTTTSNQWQCFFCQESPGRWQERDRHELAHLPFTLHCPVAGCLWRGNRLNAFRNHWQKKDPIHRSYREQYGPSTPGRSQIETFNAKDILDQIKSGAISLSEGQDEAILLVQVKSYELEKPDMMTHPWGRNRRH